jgi:competence protein ComEC
MIFFWQLSSILFKKKNPYSSLCWSCLLVLIVNPSSILSIGFQLSYTVVLTILIFSYHINQKFNHSFLGFSSFTKNSLMVSYSAFCGSLLLIYDHFDIIVPVSILINVLAIPITFIFIICIFSMLIFQNIIAVEIFGEVFLILYNLLKSIIMLLSHENISFFFIRNKVDLNNVVHFLYPLFFLLYFSMVKNFYLKIIGHLLIPIILIVLFSYVFV